MRAGRTPAPLLGRGTELSRLDSLLARAQAGTGSLVVLRGEHGSGLTRLLEEAADRATELGFLVLRTAGQDSPSRPFGAVLAALGDALVLPDVRPPGSEGPVRGDRAAAFAATISEAIERRCTETPVALLIDDLDHCDGGTLRVLRALAPSAPMLPLAVLAAEGVSPDEPGVLDHIADVLPISRLDPATAVALATALWGGPLDEEIERRLPLGRGLPGAITDLVVAAEAGVEAEGSLHASARLAALDPRALRLVRAAAVLGNWVEIVDVAVLADEGPREVAAALGTAVALAIVRLEGDAVCWNSEAVRADVEAELPLAVRSAMHDEAGRALADRGAAPSMVAGHLVLGAGTFGPDAPEWLRRAARETWTADPQVAIRFLRHAVELAGPLSPLRDDLMQDMLDPLLWTNQLAEGEAVARELLARATDPARARDARLGLALALQHQGRNAEAARLFDDLGPEDLVGDPDRAAVVLAELGYSALVGGDLVALRSRVTLSDQLAALLGHPGLACSAATLRCLSDLAEGRPLEALRAAEQAVEAGGESWIGTPGACVALALARIDADRLGEVAAALQLGRELADRVGSASHVPALHWASIGHAFAAGEWDQALAQAEDGIALAEEIGAASGRALAHALRGVVLLHRGDVSAAVSAVESAEASVISHGPQLGIDLALWARGLMHEADGDIERALAVLTTAWDVMASLRYLVTYRIVAPDLVRVALAGGDHDRASSVVATVDEGARRAGIHSTAAVALRCRGLVERSSELLLTAVEHARVAPRPFDRAATLADAALQVAADGGVDSSAALADEALAGFEQLGATRPADRLISELRAFGIHRSRSRTAPDPGSGWGALTDAEAKVARLVAEGLTNREVAARLFLSRHTVDSHLRHVFTKLGIRSRIELVRGEGRA